MFPNVIRHIHRAIRAAADWLAAIDACHREGVMLRRLDDHLLRDIGITRTDLAAARSASAAAAAKSAPCRGVGRPSRERPYSAAS